MIRSRQLLLTVLAACSPWADAQEPVDFATQVKPILESACVSCHNEEKAEGELRLDTLEFALQGGEYGPSIVPGKPDESESYVRVMLPDDDDDIMPPKGEPLSKLQKEVLHRWITDGAKWPDDMVLGKVKRIDFSEDIQFVLESNCVACHKDGEEEAGLNIVTREKAFTTGDNGPSIIPFKPEDSLFYTLANLDPDDEDIMPPKRSGDPLPRKTLDLLKMWIEQGAVWPDGIVLKQKAKSSSGAPETYDNIDLVRKIHALIAEKSKDDEFKAYTDDVPLSKTSFEMIPIQGGTFKIGSPDKEKMRSEVEGPQVEVSISPFWMGATEVTWNAYDPFMITKVDRYKNGAPKTLAVSEDLVTGLIAALSMPTTPYVEMSFGMGQDGYPAISMTQHAANKFCQWVSVQTGHFYRLPTEAEWEYACRAGTTTAYSFGDDPSQLGDYGWFFENSNGRYQKVAQKKPNPWGLYDMHGNAREWTLDQFAPDFYGTLKGEATRDPWNKPVTLYPRSVRGGGWDDDPDQLRSAARVGSHENWKQTDPQLPKSLWYHTDAKWLGFRMVRPQEIPTAEKMFEAWNIGRPAKKKPAK